MIRVSESADHTLSTSREPRWLTKREFVERVDARASRWRQSFRLSRLNEFMKQGLIEPAARRRNDGLNPNYSFGCSHYRRALQLMRLRAAGFRDSDALLVQLFIRGYRIGVELFRAAVIKEAERAATMLNAPIRSTYADRDGPVPPKRKASLLAQIGDQDERFKGGRYELDPSLALNLVRIARAAPPHQPEAPLAAVIPRERGSIVRMFGGLLMITDSKTADKTIIALVVEAADQSLLVEVQAMMAGAISRLRAQAQLEVQISSRADCQIAVANWWRREFLAMNFVVILNVMIQNHGHGSGATGSKL